MCSDIRQLQDKVDDFLPEVLRKLAKVHVRGLRGSRAPIRHGPERRNRTTEDDIAVDRFLREVLSKRFPTIGFVSEEFSPTPLSAGQTYWVIDPIDGTLNYTQHYPHYAISVALFHNNDVIYGCVFDPERDETFRCKKGRGVYLHGGRLPKLSRQNISEVLIAAGCGYDDYRAQIILRTLAHVQKQVLGIRLTGCASLDLAYVAASRFACFVHPYLKVWDQSASGLMVREVGGSYIEVERLKTDNSKCFVAGEESIAQYIYQLIQDELSSQDEKN